MSILAAVGGSILSKFASSGIDNLMGNDEEKKEDEAENVADQAKTSIPTSFQDFGNDIASGAYKGLGRLATSALARGGENLLEKWMEPSPSQRGTMEGLHKKAMFDAFAPGTSGFERIGSAGAGASSIPATQQGLDARKAIDKQMAHQKEIERMKIEGAIRVAEISSDPAHREVDRKTELLPAQKQKIEAEIKEIAQNITTNRHKGWEHYWSSRVFREKSHWMNAIQRAEVNLMEAQTQKAENESELIVKQTITEMKKALKEGSEAELKGAMVQFKDDLAQGAVNQAFFGHFRALAYVILKMIGVKNKVVENLEEMMGAKPGEKVLPYQHPNPNFNPPWK